MRCATTSLLLMLFAVAAVNARASDEERVVRAMIAAAVEDRLSAFLSTIDWPQVATNSHGECTPAGLVAVAKLLNRPGLKLETLRSGDTRLVRASQEPEITAIFYLRSTAKTPDYPEGRLMIAAVKVEVPNGR